MNTKSGDVKDLEEHLIYSHTLWTGAPLPNSDKIPVLKGVEFSVIKTHQPEVDGCNWVLGTALAWHNGLIYASYGFNEDPQENTATEQARGQISKDGGKTWGDDFIIDTGEGDLGVSHGVFLTHESKLWAFQGAFHGRFERTHTRAYLLDDSTGVWKKKGVVIDAGFWPMQEPLRMTDGNWIMSGIRVKRANDGWIGNLPAVAISDGDDFTSWEMIIIQPDAGLENQIWGESTVYLHGSRIVNISRSGPHILGADGKICALTAVSDDCGRTWTRSSPSNLAMTPSKPYTGTLSNGMHYLIGTTSADCGTSRNLLTISVSTPGAVTFDRVFVIRHAVFPDGPGPSHAGALLSYPYAVEHEGRLYVGYADKKIPTVEMAIIPISALASSDSP